MDTGSTALDKHFGELHHSGDTTVASVTIGNDRTEVINLGGLGTLLGGHGQTRLALLAVMEQLGKEEVLDLVGDSVHGVVGKIRTGLVASGRGRRALPAAHVAIVGRGG